MFIPAPGNDFIIADYAGIELSILAAMCKDTQLTNQILSGDIHSFVTNSLIPDKLLQVLGSLITPKNKKEGLFKVIRDLFKKVSYGIIYGSTGYNLYRTLYFDLLGAGIVITRDECDIWVERWKHELFPGTGELLQKNSELAITQYYTTSALGRRRHWTPEVRFDKWRMFAAMREGSNHPIQGTCADMLKRAMVYIDNKIDPKRARIVACIHDELLLETNKEYTASAMLLVKEYMEMSARSFYPDADPMLFIAEPKFSSCYDK